jgi:hypothetical protein
VRAADAVVKPFCGVYLGVCSRIRVRSLVEVEAILGGPAVVSQITTKDAKSTKKGNEAA